MEKEQNLPLWLNFEKNGAISYHITYHTSQGIGVWMATSVHTNSREQDFTVGHFVDHASNSD